MGQVATKVAYHIPFLQPAAEYFMSQEDIQKINIAKEIASLAVMIHNDNNNNNNNNNNSDNNNKSNLSTEEALAEVLEHRSPFHGLFDDESGENRQEFQIEDYDDDGDDDDDEEEGGMAGFDGSQRRSKLLCSHCHNFVTPRDGIKCQCESETYCSLKCQKWRRRRHREKCARKVQFEKMEKYMMATSPDETYGCLRDIPGLEHEFLGGSKYSIVLRIGKRALHYDDVFHCKDREGQSTKLKVRYTDPDLIEKLTSQPPYNLYVSVAKAFVQPLQSESRSKIKGGTCTGLVYNPQSIPLFYRCLGETDDGAFIIQIILPLPGNEMVFGIDLCEF